MFRRLRTYVMCAFGSGPGAHYMMSNCETGELDRVSDLERKSFHNAPQWKHTLLNSKSLSPSPNPGA